MRTFTPIEAAAKRSQLVREAHERARVAHAGQVRNASGGMPYFEHPVEVARRLAEHGFSDEVLAAALLHDVVEDTEITVAELRAEFGPEVAGLVAALSDDESVADYLERKDEHRRRVAADGAAAVSIYAADKLTNVVTLRYAYARQGETVAEELKVSLDTKLEIWDADVEMLGRQDPEPPVLAELRAELASLREDRAAAAPATGA